MSDHIHPQSGRTYQPEPLPRRGDQFEQWLKAQRDGCQGYPAVWQAAEDLLGLYRLHADTRTPLDQHVYESGNVDDCADCYEQEVRR